MKSKKLISILMILLILMIPIAIADSFSEIKTKEVKTPLLQGPGIDPGQACSQKAATIDQQIIEEEEDSEKVAKIFFTLSAICTAISTTHVIWSSIIVGLSAIPGGQAFTCAPNPAETVFAVASIPCAFVTSGFICGAFNLLSMVSPECGTVQNVLGSVATRTVGAGVDPYASMTEAKACVSIPGILFNKRKKRIIDKSYSCCLTRACEAGLPTESCEQYRSYSMCMYEEGARKKLLARLIASVVTAVAAEAVACMFINAAIVPDCIQAAIHVVSIPKMLEGLGQSFAYVSEVGTLPDCSELGFNEVKDQVTARNPADPLGMGDVDIDGNLDTYYKKYDEFDLSPQDQNIFNLKGIKYGFGTKSLHTINPEGKPEIWYMVPEQGARGLFKASYYKLGQNNELTKHDKDPFGTFDFFKGGYVAPSDVPSLAEHRNFKNKFPDLTSTVKINNENYVYSGGRFHKIGQVTEGTERATALAYNDLITSGVDIANFPSNAISTQTDSYTINYNNRVISRNINTNNIDLTVGQNTLTLDKNTFNNVFGNGLGDIETTASGFKLNGHEVMEISVGPQFLSDTGLNVEGKAYAIQKGFIGKDIRVFKTDKGLVEMDFDTKKVSIKNDYWAGATDLESVNMKTTFSGTDDKTTYGNIKNNNFKSVTITIGTDKPVTFDQNTINNANLKGISTDANLARSAVRARNEIGKDFKYTGEVRPTHDSGTGYEFTSEDKTYTSFQSGINELKTKNAQGGYTLERTTKDGITKNYFEFQDKTDGPIYKHEFSEDGTQVVTDKTSNLIIFQSGTQGTYFGSGAGKIKLVVADGEEVEFDLQRFYKSGDEWYDTQDQKEAPLSDENAKRLEAMVKIKSEETNAEETSKKFKESEEKAAQKRKEATAALTEEGKRTELSARQKVMWKNLMFQIMWFFGNQFILGDIYEEIDQDCQEEYLSSEPESSTPTSTNNQGGSGGQGGSVDYCQGSELTTIAAQVYRSGNQSPYYYNYTYTVTACNQTVGYQVTLENSQLQNLDQGTLNLGNMLTAENAIISTELFNRICINVTDQTILQTCTPSVNITE